MSVTVTEESNDSNQGIGIIIRSTAFSLPYFTADDIQKKLIATYGSPVSTGELNSHLSDARKIRLISKTGQFIRSRKPNNHGSHRQVWKSNIYHG